MSTKKRRTITTVEEEPGEETAAGSGTAADSAAQEAEDLREFASFDSRIRVWKAEEDADKSGFVATLYRSDPYNKKKTYFCWDGANEVLSSHEIGMKFGPGDYRFLLTPNDPKKKFRTAKVNIDRHYTKLRQEAGIEDAPPSAVSGNGGGLAQSLELVKQVVELIRPLLPQPAAAAAADGGLMAAQMKAFSQGMQEMMADNFRFMRQITGDIRRQALEPPAPREGDEGDMVDGQETLIDTIERVWPMVEPFIKKLLGQGPASDEAAETIKGNPEFKRILSSAKKFSAFVQIMDEKLGQGDVDEALKKIGVHRPR
jgi:hypothetical protein